MAFACNSDSNKLMILSLLVSFLVLFHVLPSTKADLVDDACAEVADVEFCKAALRSDGRTGGADLKSLAQIGIDLMRPNIQSTISLVKSLLAGVSVTDPSLKQSYETCLEVYNDASDELQACPGDLKNQNYASLYNHAIQVTNYADTCDDHFSGEPEELAQAGQKVQSLAGVVAYASDMLQRN